MAKPRKRPDLVAPILGDRPIIPATLRVDAIEKDINDVVSKGLGQRLNVAPGSLPQDLKDVIATTSAAAAQRAIELAVTQDVNEAVGGVTRGSVLNRFDARVDLAKQGLVHISQSDDVKEIMVLAAVNEALRSARGLMESKMSGIVPGDLGGLGGLLPGS